MSDIIDYGTLGFSSEDQLDFFGSNANAYIDDDCMLHGLPPFDALSKGLVVCLCPLHDKCFYVYLEECWDRFVGGIKAGLLPEGEESPDPQVLARIERIIEEPPNRASFIDGRVHIPRHIVESCGMQVNEQLLIIGNSGHFEIWRKPAFEELLESFNIFSILMDE